MILSLIFLILVLVVAFFHYLQGFLSATISAILAAVSVLVAFTLYEPLITMMAPGKFADSAHAMMLVVLFAFTYLILRLIFDKVIPGNVRVPAIVDKIGGGVMGFIVGCLAVGLLAVAAQALPFGPSIGGYARYRVKPDAKVDMPIREGQNRDRMVYSEYAERTFDADTRHDSLLLPVDDMVVGFVSMQSRGGATAGGQPFAAIHPNYLQELFGNRIGLEQGAKRSAQPIGGSEVVDVLGVYVFPGKRPNVPQVDGEFAAIRKPTDDEKLPAKLELAEDESPLVVRMLFKLDASDIDKLVRVSTGSVRLVIPTKGGGYQQYFPIGTVEGGKILIRNKPDDFLFLGADKAVDFCFVIKGDIPANPSKPEQIASNAGMFIEAKRYGRVDLGGKTVEAIKEDERVSVLRKPLLQKKLPADPEAGKRRILGSWRQEVSGGDPILFTYTADNKMVRTNKIAGQDVATPGTWKVLDNTNEGLVIEETIGGKANKVKINFQADGVVRHDPNPVAIKKVQ